MKVKKIVITEPHKVELLEKEETLAIEQPNDVIIKTHYSHISAGTELACLAGIETFLDIPGTPGYTAVGEVLDLGENVTGLKKGDIVYSFGPHAEYFKIDNTDRWGGLCVKVPEGTPPDKAAFTHMAGIAMTSLRTSDIELGDWVLVTGLGTIGNLAAQLAQMQGANVIATDVSDRRLEIARNSGISNVLNPAKENLKGKIEQLTNGNLVSTLIDASGLSPVIEQSLELVKLYGEVILLGSPRAPYETNLTSVLQKFHLLPNCLTMKGALEFTYPTHENEFVKHSIEMNSRIILDLIRDGRIVIDHVYSHKMSPAEAQKAYDGLKNKVDEYIGVVFDWSL